MSLVSDWGPAVLIIAGAVASAAGGVWFGFVQTRKSGEIAELNQRIAASVIGGDSFCYVAFSGYERSDEVILVISHEGEFPIYDVSVEIIDLNKRRNQPENLRNTLEGREAATKRIPVGNLAPSQSRLYGSWRLPATEVYQAYNIFISARNGFVVQQLRFRRVDGRWTRLSKVTRRGPKGLEVILERVSDDFPGLEADDEEEISP